MRSPRPPRLAVRWTSVLILLLVGPAVWLVVAAQPAPLTLVSTAWPPFTNVRGQPRFALDLVEAALSRVNVSSKTTILGPEQFTSALLSGLFDGSAAAWKDAERESLLIFSQPYLQNRLVLVGKRGADVSARALADLKGKRVAIVEGYSYGDAIDAAGPTWVRARGEEECLTRVLKGGADYTLMDELVVTYIVSRYPKESDTKLQIGTTPLLTRELYFTVRRTRADAQSIVDQFNAQLRGMIADRTYHRLLHVDWIRADVNGDGAPVNVPASDQAGPSEPRHAYVLFTAPPNPAETPTKTGFYFGGTIYSDWASVPENYKTSNSDRPDPRRSTASVFRFGW
jgi:polar amino acid transport system substrate-binding protein